jgi:hypothetical protein
MLATLAAVTVVSSAAAQPQLISVPGSPGLLLGAAPTPQVIRDGRIKADVSQFDAGKPADLFDGNYSTFLRTPSQNALAVEIVLDEAVRCYGIRIKIIDCKLEYTLVAARSSGDLRAKSGSYRVLAAGMTPFSEDIVYAVAEPMAYSAFRLDVRRVEGDDMRIAEWEFLEPITPASLKVEYRVRTSHGDGEKSVHKPLDDQATRPTDSLFVPRVLVTSADGRTFDGTPVARVSSSSPGVRPWEVPPSLELTTPGTVQVAVELAGLKQTGEITVTPRQSANRAADLDVLFIERLPRIAFDAPNGGWPAAGQDVTWRAHIQNWGEADVTTRYRWLLDQTESTGTLTIPAGEEVSVDMPWVWEQKRHTLLFEVDPNNQLHELVKHNNKLEVVTDALTVGFYVDRSYADYFHEHQHELGLDDANSFADWGQRTIRHWNKMLRESYYPEAPQGALDRVRLDLVRVVPDQAIPFQGGNWPTNYPNLEDKSVDLLWGFPYKFDQWKEPLDIAAIRKGIAAQNLGVHWFFLDLALIHELNHARYLIDTYGCDVHVGGASPENAAIRIKDDQGRWICGTYLQKEGMVHCNRYEGDMGGPYEIYGPYEIVMLNRVAGQRAQGGNCNGTSRIGSYLQDMPKQFKIAFVGPSGEALANDPVKVYWAQPRDEWYGKLYDNTVDREFTTDSNGCITTDKTFFAADGKIVHTYGHSNVVTIVRVDHESRTYYIFLEATEVNMLANVSKEPVPLLRKVVPLRTGEPRPLPPDYDRRRAPDWHTRTLFEVPK